MLVNSHYVTNNNHIIVLFDAPKNGLVKAWEHHFSFYFIFWGCQRRKNISKEGFGWGVGRKSMSARRQLGMLLSPRMPIPRSEHLRT